MENHFLQPKTTKLPTLSEAEVQKIHGYQGWETENKHPRQRFYRSEILGDENDWGCRYLPIIHQES
jgi:hypothetical protein